MANLVKKHEYEKIKNTTFSVFFFQNGKRTHKAEGCSIIHVVREIKKQTRQNANVTPYIFDEDEIVNKAIDTTHRDQKYFTQFL